MKKIFKLILKILLIIVLAVVLLCVAVATIPSCSWFNKSGTEMEENYIRYKSSFKSHVGSFPGENLKYEFLNRNKFSDDEYVKVKYMYQIFDFEEAVMLRSKNGGWNYCLVVKTDAENAKKFLQDKIDNYYHFQDYYVLDFNWAHRFFDRSYIYASSGHLTITKEGKVLIEISDNYPIDNDCWVIPEGVYALTDNVFNELAVKQLICNVDLIRIGLKTFANSQTLEKIRLNAGLQQIATQAFYGCTNLKQIVIPSTVEMIGSKAFSNTVVYCEAESKPDGWEDDFAVENAKVYYANEWHYDDAGNPVPNS